MSLSDDVRAELLALAQSYMSGKCSVGDILTFEVEHSDLDLEIDDALRDRLTSLSLFGHEYLMNLRPIDDFEQSIHEVLSDSATAADAAGA